MEIPVLDRIVLGGGSSSATTSEDNYGYVTDVVRICSEIETDKKLWDMRMKGQARKKENLLRMLEEVG